MEEPWILSSNTQESNRNEKQVYKEPELSADHSEHLRKVGITRSLTFDFWYRQDQGRSYGRCGIRNVPGEWGEWKQATQRRALSRERAEHKHLHRKPPNTYDGGGGTGYMVGRENCSLIIIANIIKCLVGARYWPKYSS